MEIHDINWGWKFSIIRSDSISTSADGVVDLRVVVVKVKVEDEGNGKGNGKGLCRESVGRIVERWLQVKRCSMFVR